MIAELSALFERIVAELPPEAATLTVDSAPSGTVFELRPSNASSAGIAVFADDREMLNFTCGPISTWELEWQRRYCNGEKDLIVEIEEMTRAVIAGAFETYRGLFWLTGRIHVEDYTYQITHLPMLPKTPFGVRRYEPYVNKI